MHADVGEHRGTTAIPIRLAGDLANSLSRRRGLRDRLKYSHFCRHRRDEVVETLPWRLGGFDVRRRGTFA